MRHATTLRANAYRANAILGSSREQLVPLLYEQLMVSLTRGAALLREGNIEGKSLALGKASDILFELLESLDFKEGGEVAPRLASLYAYFLQEIETAGRTLDPEPADRVLGMVQRLQEAWREAAGGSARGAP